MAVTYQYNIATVLARFLRENEGKASVEYLLENAFRYWKHIHETDIRVEGGENYNTAFNYRHLLALEIRS